MMSVRTIVPISAEEFAQMMRLVGSLRSKTLGRWRSINCVKNFADVSK